MDTMTAFLTLLSSGGVLYLIAEKILNRNRDKADVQSTVISNSNEIADLFNKIDEIVESKTAPIREELKDIKENWCCYRANCAERLMVKPKDNEVDN